MKNLLTFAALGLGIAAFGTANSAQADGGGHQATAAYRGGFHGGSQGGYYGGYGGGFQGGNRGGYQGGYRGGYQSGFRGGYYGAGYHGSGWGYRPVPPYGYGYGYPYPVYRNSVIIRSPGCGVNYYGW